MVALFFIPLPSFLKSSIRSFLPSVSFINRVFSPVSHIWAIVSLKMLHQNTTNIQNYKYSIISAYWCYTHWRADKHCPVLCSYYHIFLTIGYLHNIQTAEILSVTFHMSSPVNTFSKLVSFPDMQKNSSTEYNSQQKPHLNAHQINRKLFNHSSPTIALFPFSYTSSPPFNQPP